MYDTTIFAFIALVDASSNYILNQNNEILSKNQSKWLEIVLDFILNVQEKSTLTRKYNYDDSICSIEFLKMFHKILEKTSLLSYLISSLNLYAIKFNITKYLIDFINKCCKKLFDKQIDQWQTIDSFTIAVYIISMIKSTKEYDINLNLKINHLLVSYYDIYTHMIQSSDDNLKKISINYLIGLTQTLCCLYDEESAFYDEQNVLKNLFDLINNTSMNHYLSESITNRCYWTCRICLTCIAYKSNLIENYQIKCLLETPKTVSNEHFVSKL